MRARLEKLEKKQQKTKEITLPLFLETEGEDILFYNSLLIDLGINPEDYPYLRNSEEYRKVNKGAEFIDRIEVGDRLFLKDHKDKVILIL